MGLYEYTILSEEKQWEILWEKGEFITNLKMIDASFSLYAIDKFFIEVEWNDETDEIVGKGAFKCGDNLDRYSNVPKEI